MTYAPVYRIPKTMAAEDSSAYHPNNPSTNPISIFHSFPALHETKFHCTKPTFLVACHRHHYPQRVGKDLNGTKAVRLIIDFNFENHFCNFILHLRLQNLMVCPCLGHTMAVII